MKLVVLAVRDRALDAFGTPLFVSAVGQGVRSFGDEVNRAAEGNALNAHPEDFDLYELGVFETDTGRFNGLDDPRLICVGKDVARV